MILKTSNGKQTKVTAAEIKKTKMKANGWNASQYQKKYDIFKNRLRAYESFRAAGGNPLAPQSPAELLYKQAKAKLRHGADYKPSAQMRAIQSMAAVSITKGRKQAAQAFTAPEKPTARKTIKQKYRARVLNSFEAFISAHPQAQELALKYVDNPVLMEKALSDYAAKVEEERKKQAAKTGAEAIPEGDKTGSPDVITEIDYEAYEYDFIVNKV